MPGDAIIMPAMTQHPGLRAIREKSRHVELESILVRLVCWVGILHKVLTQDNTLRVCRMYHYASGQVARLAQTLIPHDHFIEIGALVKADDAMFQRSGRFLPLSG